jgi:two-component system chemotaxis response regulator CheB
MTTMTTQASGPKAEAIVIGGSAGALEALSVILPALSPALEPPIALVLHLAGDKPSYLAEVLSARSPLAVREVEDKSPILPRTIHVAPPGYHLLVERSGHFALSVDEPVLFCRPAIDVLFESAADVYRSRLVAVLLTGANEDGARGLARVKARGGTTIVQSPDEAQVRTMPEAALRLGAADHVLGLGGIAPLLNSLGVDTARASSRPFLEPA